MNSEKDDMEDIQIRHFIDLTRAMSVKTNSSNVSWIFAKQIADELGEYEIWFLQNIVRQYDEEARSRSKMARKPA